MGHTRCGCAGARLPGRSSQLGASIGPLLSKLAPRRAAAYPTGGAARRGLAAPYRFSARRAVDVAAVAEDDFRSRTCAGSLLDRISCVDGTAPLAAARACPGKLQDRKSTRLNS